MRSLLSATLKEADALVISAKYVTGAFAQPVTRLIKSQVPLSAPKPAVKNTFRSQQEIPT